MGPNNRFIPVVRPHAETSLADQYPSLPLIAQAQNSRGVDNPRLLVQFPFGHPSGLFGGEPLAHKANHTGSVCGVFPL